MKISELLLLTSLGLAVACGGEAESPESDTPRTGKSSSGAQVNRDGTTPPPRAGTNKDEDTEGDEEAASDQPKSCDKLMLLAQPKSPNILIVLDRSGSMVLGVDRWTPSINAITKLTAELTQTVKFGLMLFPDPSMSNPATDWTSFLGIPGTACAPGKIDVPTKLNSAPDIERLLRSGQARPSTGNTPTAKTLEAAKAVITPQVCPDCTIEPAYVLLVTDGAPTCGAGGAMTTPEDIAATTAAITDLKNGDVLTYVVGFGLDAAGAATMNQFAQAGGTEKYLPVEDEQSLLAELVRITGSLVPCEYELKTEIENPEFVRVQIDKQTYKYGEDWTVEGKKIILKDGAAACNKLRDAKIHDLNITRECEPVIYL